MNLYGKSVSLTAAAMYTVLCSLTRTSQRTGHKDHRGVYVYASRRQLGQYIDRSERTAQRAIAELKAAGLIRVKRMGLHSNDRIYVVGYDGSVAVNNGGSEITKGSNNNYTDISIRHDKKPQMTAKTVDDAKKAEAVARIATPAAEKVKAEGYQYVKKDQAKKGRPTEKRRQRITKREKQAAKEKYSRLLEQKLKMASPRWFCDDAESVAEFKSTYALIDLISDAMAVPGAQIRVNGAVLTVEQYWNMVQYISPDAIEGLLSRIEAVEITTGITNKRAYTLAAVYNAVQWHELSSNVNVSMNDLYRHMA